MNTATKEAQAVTRLSADEAFKMGWLVVPAFVRGANRGWHIVNTQTQVRVNKTRFATIADALKWLTTWLG